jgi:hypothetical protein
MVGAQWNMNLIGNLLTKKYTKKHEKISNRVLEKVVQTWCDSVSNCCIGFDETEGRRIKHSYHRNCQNHQSLAQMPTFPPIFHHQNFKKIIIKIKKREKKRKCKKSRNQTISISNSSTRTRKRLK